jgi:hypothetical protein
MCGNRTVQTVGAWGLELALRPPSGATMQPMNERERDYGDEEQRLRMDCGETLLDGGTDPDERQ